MTDREATPRLPASAFRQDIEGLRGIAVLAVVAYHTLGRAYDGGAYGVDVFFVISGFLMTGMLAGTASQSGPALRDFYARRARRILPALFVMLTVVMALAWITMSPIEFAEAGARAGGAGVFVANIVAWRQGHGYFGPNVRTDPLLHVWSLSVEEQFYLLFPLAFLMTRGPRVRWRLPLFVTLAAVSLALMLWRAGTESFTAFLLLPVRVFELLAGVLAWMARDRGCLSRCSPRLADLPVALSLAGIVLTLTWLGNGRGFPDTIALLPVGCTAVLMALGDKSGLGSRLLGIWPLRAAGAISYSLYLWHQPVLAFARRLDPIGVLSGNFALTFAASLVLAMASFHLVEQPTRRTRNLSRLIRVLAVSGAAIAACGLAIHLGAIQVPMTPEDRRMHGSVVQATAELSRCLGAGSGVRSFPAPCSSGDARVEPTIAIVGDSMAGAFGIGAARDIAAQGKRAVILSGAACPPSFDDGASELQFTQGCAAFMRRALDHVNSHPEIQTVVVIHRWSHYWVPRGVQPREVTPTVVATEQSERFKRVSAAAEAYFDAWRKGGRRLVVVGSFPEPTFSVPEALMLRRRFFADTDLSMSLQSVQSYVAWDRALFAGVTGLPQVTVVQPAGFLCQGGNCPVAIGGEALYLDEVHPTALAVSSIARHIDW